MFLLALTLSHKVFLLEEDELGRSKQLPYTTVHITVVPEVAIDDTKL